MTTRTRLSLCALMVSIVAAVWQYAAGQQPDRLTPGDTGATSKSPVTTEQLGGADRYLTHVSTDKPIYRPGETAYLRGVLLHAITNRPLATNTPAIVEIIGPKGDVVASGQVASEDGVLGFSWTIPAAQAGGEYTAKFTHPWTGDAPAERKFDIRVYRAPRLRSQIKFLRDGYGPGDEVVGTLEVTRAEGGVPDGAKVTIIARVDEAEVYRGESSVSADGRCVARFALPAEIARGEGSLAMVVEDGGVVETASKTLPILLQTVDLTLYPEGGELVTGVPNRVYFEALTPAQKPADLAGVVVDAAGNEVATFRSEHEGRGRFTFTPAVEGKYELRITEPAGIRTTFPLPTAKATGIVLTSLDDTASDSVRLQLMAANDQVVSVTLKKREQELDRREVELKAGEATQVRLSAGDAGGVLVATVWDADGKPLAERLVFAAPRRAVRVAIEADRPRYVPGGKASLTFTTTDETGKPTSAVVGVTVADDSVLEMIDRREQAPRLPVMALLEGDVRNLADAHVYLDAANPQAPVAVDLLLGTQGWRRFAYFDAAEFLKASGDDARRVLALRIPAAEMPGGRGGRGGQFWGGKLGLDGIDRFQIFSRGKELEEGRAIDKLTAQNAAVPALAKGLPVDGAAVPGDEVKALAPAESTPTAAESAVVASQADAAKEVEEIASAEALAVGQGRRAAGRLLQIQNGGEMPAQPIRNDFVAVRVFAHQVRPDRQPAERVDFAETLYWHVGIKTDDDGRATVEFDLNDAVTSFRVFADAFNAAGALGADNIAIESVEPLYVEPKLPLEVTSGDLVLAPLGIVNSTAESLRAEVDAISPLTTTKRKDRPTVALPADSRVRHIVTLPIGESYGPVPITFSARAGELADSVTRTITIKPAGFPIERGRGGLIDAHEVAYHGIEIPESVVKGSITAKAVVYPTPLANMTEALARLIQEPSGCFEQTSSTIYPLVMAQQYFLGHQGVDPALVEKSAAILETGYARLTGFECKDGGYEWFGSDPGHDALTAYGLMEFTDMARVRHVDPQMLERTRKWFIAQRDGKGGFVRRATTLHTWLPDAEVANAYNTWALYEAGIEGDFATEVNWVREAAKSTPNTYVVALAANILAIAGDQDGHARLLDKLAGLQQKDGSLGGATVSVVGSGGDALAIETTALAVLAWLEDEHHAGQVERGIKFLAEACKAGRFGSTQSTVLALKAITAYDSARATPKAPGELQLVVDGELVGEPVAFSETSHGAIELPAFADMLSPGKHSIELHMTGGSRMPFSIAVNYAAHTPDTSEACQLDLRVSLADARVTEGELTEARVTVENRSQETVPNPLAIVGIPGGLEVRHDQLKELVKAGQIATYEVLGRDLVLYWRSLAGGQKVELPVSVVAAIPGSYTGPASRAYLYYTDEDKTWQDGLHVDISPRQE